MKKLKSVLILALFTIGLVSCGGDSGGSDVGSCANKTATTSVTQQDATPNVTADTGCSLQSATPNPVVGTTVHDNEMAFFPSPDSIYLIAGVRFEWDNEYSITPGQPWEGVSVRSARSTDPRQGDIGYVTAKAGRKGSNTPKDWFENRNQSGSGNKFSNEAGWSNIDSLNFAFTGTLIINGHRYPVIIGQEGYGGANGWWIAGHGLETYFSFFLAR
jgi:hypothetical protein